jgi:small subunit ribosomal protein S2
LREAQRKKIPVVALANVDTDPDDIEYLVPGNDKSKKSIDWFLERVEKAIEEGMALRVVPKAEEATTGDKK